MRAMTWWDHETSSIWAQPWGMAIAGPLEGARLELLPASIVPWDVWMGEHPDTLVLDTDQGRYTAARKPFHPDFVIGIALGEHAKAYPIGPLARREMVNDEVGGVPILVTW